MSSISPTPSNLSSKSWSDVKDHVAPLIAAPTAVIFLFRYFIIKSAYQQGLPTPSISCLQGLKEGLKAAPIAGSIVGLQMVIQEVLERTLLGSSNQPTFQSMITSSVGVGILSAPVLAIFNGHTLGLNIKQSLKKFSLKQAGAITFQETAFVAGLIASDRLYSLIQLDGKDNKAFECIASFTAGSIGALIGHPANTALTCWQNRIPIVHPRQLMRGVGVRTLTMGSFALIYSTLRKALLNE